MNLRSLPLCSLALTLAALVTAALPGWPEALQFDRARIAGGEWWRIVTGHWTHWTADHLGWDVVVFAVFGTLLECRSRPRFGAVVGLAALVISAGVAFGAADLAFYRGLSGIDSALFTAVFLSLLQDLLRHRRFIAAAVPFLALAGFGAKAVFEFASGTALLVDAGASFRVVPLAHVLGALAGGAAGCLPWRRARVRAAGGDGPGAPARAGA